MSGSGGQGGGNVASGATVVGGAVALPFTGGSMIVSYVIITAMVCAAAVILSKVVKNIASRFLV